AFYLVALTGMGMLATTGVVVSEDTFGPVSDNAAGIAEMSGEFEGEPERIMVSLDAVGNTTKAVTKGFAIGSAVIAAVALFASFIETIGTELKLGKVGTALFRGAFETQINVADPKTFIGLLIGGSIAFMFSALAFLAAVILTGQLMAVFLSNSGGAWDNAKKFIEDGHYGGKGSEAHKAAVIGDTVGDPFKDTAGPALNPLIKVMNLVSLLILPAVISLRHNDTARYSIAGVALVVLAVAI